MKATLVLILIFLCINMLDYRNSKLEARVSELESAMKTNVALQGQMINCIETNSAHDTELAHLIYDVVQNQRKKNELLMHAINWNATNETTKEFLHWGTN